MKSPKYPPLYKAKSGGRSHFPAIPLPSLLRATITRSMANSKLPHQPFNDRTTSSPTTASLSSAGRRATEAHESTTTFHAPPPSHVPPRRSSSSCSIGHVPRAPRSLTASTSPLTPSPAIHLHPIKGRVEGVQEWLRCPIGAGRGGVGGCCVRFEIGAVIWLEFGHRLILKLLLELKKAPKRGIVVIGTWFAVLNCSDQLPVEVTL